MADKIKLLTQKRTSLKAQITGLANILDKGSIDNNILKLRIARLTELYHAFEEYHDELIILDPNDAHQTEFLNIQERFYVLAGRIDSVLNETNTTSIGSGILNDEIHENQVDNPYTIITVKRRRIKLPEAPLPMMENSKVGSHLKTRLLA